MNLHTDLEGTELVAVVSAVVTGVAAFLPWVAGVQAGPISVEATQRGIDGLGAVTLLLAVVVIGAILVFGTEAMGPAATTVSGLLVAALAVWKLTDLGELVEPGIGIYITIIGGLGILLGGGLTYRGHVETSGAAEPLD